MERPAVIDPRRRQKRCPAGAMNPAGRRRERGTASWEGRPRSMSHTPYDHHSLRERLDAEVEACVSGSNGPAYVDYLASLR